MRLLLVLCVCTVDNMECWLLGVHRSTHYWTKLGPVGELKWVGRDLTGLPDHQMVIDNIYSTICSVITLLQSAENL